MDLSLLSSFSLGVSLSFSIVSTSLSTFSSVLPKPLVPLSSPSSQTKSEITQGTIINKVHQPSKKILISVISKAFKPNITPIKVDTTAAPITIYITICKGFLVFSYVKSYVIC